MYMALKHTHMLLILVSALLFIGRFLLVQTGSPLANNKPLKIVPHIANTLLLVTGLGLMMITGYSLFNPSGAWILNKLSCVLAYVALGVFAFRGKNGFICWFSFLGALGWLFLAYNIAMTKSATLFG